MELGIAGVPENAGEVAELCRRLRVDPVFVLAPGETLPPACSRERTLRVPGWDTAACLAPICEARLAGLWPASCVVRRAVAGLSAHLNFPHLPCMAGALQSALPIAGARAMDLHALEHLPESERRGLPLPVWVRAVCGDGDASCMQVDHTKDLDLTAIKLRKRGVEGAVRVQPVADGPIYRLMAFKAGRELVPFDIAAEETTTSMFRVPLGFALPVARRGALLQHIVAVARDVNCVLPRGWGYVEMEFVDTGAEVCLVDVRCPARLDPYLRDVVYRSQGVDLLQAVLQCALGRLPGLTPTKEVGVAMTWLLTRSGEVTGTRGLEEARAMPGVGTVHIVAQEGDILTHVVDITTRNRGGYIVATGSTAAVAKARLEAARDRVWINTSPALS